MSGTPPEPNRRTACPNCGFVSRREQRGLCVNNCGAYLIPTEGMPVARLQTKAYKQDSDGSWRLAFDPNRGR